MLQYLMIIIIEPKYINKKLKERSGNQYYKRKQSSRDFESLLLRQIVVILY